MDPAPQHETVTGMLEARLGQHADRVALMFEGATWTYQELHEEALRAAATLRRLGVEEGGRVACMIPNCPEFVFLLLGCALSGSALVPINTELTAEGRDYILEHAEPTHFFSTPEQLAAELAQDQPAGSTAAVERHTPLTIIYTSGTTGRPKGVVLPHYSYCSTGAYFAGHLGCTEDDVFHTVLPLFHVNAQQSSLMGALARGATLALGRRFSANRFWAEVNSTGATVTNTIGTMVTVLIKNDPTPEERTHNLRYLISAPVPAEHFETVRQRFGVPGIEGYGLTETATLCLFNPVDAPRKGSCGKPVSHAELTVSVEGEILARPLVPDCFMNEYYQDPEATERAWEGGWFHTGDRGSIDEDGYFYFIDRIKDIIRRRGENISSVEVERAAMRHPGVGICAAVGIPSELGEEDVKLFVVPAEGAAIEADDLREFVAERVPRFAAPTEIEFRSALPMTETQRVKKYELKAEGVQAQERR